MDRPICKTEGCNRVVERRGKSKKTGKQLYRTLCHQCRRPGILERYSELSRKQVLDYYGRKCVFCGNSDERVLTVDHIDNLGHLHRKNGRRITSARLYQEIVEGNFPDTYQILCRNCNWIKYIEWLKNFQKRT